MSHVHTVYIEQLLLWYKNYYNKILFFEAAYDITLNFKICLHT
jgi:hypothetical protein